jgi:hypothetical protein
MAATSQLVAITARFRLDLLGLFCIAIAATAPAHAIIITPTFDSAITGNVAIQGSINAAINIDQSLYTDPITVSILFRYSTTEVNGNPLPAGLLARSNWVFYTETWATYIAALIADAKTGNDAMANASLPGAPLATNIDPSSADGRAVGLNTPGVMQANGTVGGGTFDGIVTINSNQPFQFSRSGGILAGNFDAQRSIEHEIDEVLGFGSNLNLNQANAIRPQDLFSWSSPGTRNLTSTGTRYFSIDGGTTNIIGFNQSGAGDFGDWLSGGCPQGPTAFVQNAFSCPGEFSDVSATSPEGINLDVIGYDMVSAKVPEPASITLLVFAIGLLAAARWRAVARRH